jgi:sodium/proline symporter
MSIALVVIVFFGINQAGGFSNVMANAGALPGYLNLNQGYDAATGTAGSFGFLPVVSTLAWGLGYFGMPHILLRFMAIRNEDELKISRRIASVWVVISMSVAILIGIIGYSVSLTGKIPMLSTSSDSETIIIKLADLMSQHGLLLALMAGIILAGILAATMSTADSQLLAASSSVSQDLMQDFLGKKLTQKSAMIAARATVIVIAVIAIILAWDPNSSVFKVVSFAWAGFGATFGPTMLLALFWKRSNLQGAFAGLIAGGAMVFIWKFAIAPVGGVFAIYELLPAFIISLLANVIVSLMTKAPDREIIKVYEEVRASK